MENRNRRLLKKGRTGREDLGFWPICLRALIAVGIAGAVGSGLLLLFAWFLAGAENPGALLTPAAVGVALLCGVVCGVAGKLLLPTTAAGTTLFCGFLLTALGVAASLLLGGAGIEREWLAASSHRLSALMMLLWRCAVVVCVWLGAFATEKIRAAGSSPAVRKKISKR